MGLRVGIVGFGGVGRTVAERLAAGAIPGLRLTAVSTRNLGRLRDELARFAPPPSAVEMGAIAAQADIVVECATAAALPAIAEAVLQPGKTLMAVSAAGLADRPDLLELATARGATLRIASGALVGLDAVRAAAEGTIRSLRLINRNHPRAYAGEAAAAHVDPARLQAEAMVLFEGSAREAARRFPRHLNVATTLSLAGIGLDRTRVEIRSDPALTGASLTIELDGEEGGFTTTSWNVPNPANPRTSRMVALSILATLRTLVSSVQVGT